MTVDPKPLSTAPPSKPPEPPQTVADLRALMLAVSRGQSDVVLGPKARRALGRMLDLQGDPALLSITTLAERLEVNPSTITRLARALGFSGFGALQEVLLNAAMTGPGAFYTRQARTALASAGAPAKVRAERLCRESQANIDRFVDAFDAENHDRAAEIIMSARRVSVHGIRQMHALASFLAYGLRMIRSDVSMLDSATLGMAEGLGALSPGDVLISSSCAPYSAPVIAVARAAQSKGIDVLALTDTPASPLVAVSRVALFAPHETSFLSNSLSTFIVAAECLINNCAAARPDQAQVALAERDRMIKQLGVES